LVSDPETCCAADEKLLLMPRLEGFHCSVQALGAFLFALFDGSLKKLCQLIRTPGGVDFFFYFV